MAADETSDGVWLDRLCLRYGFRDKSTLVRDLRDIRGRLRDSVLADRFLDIVARRVGETSVPTLALTSLDRLIGSFQDPDAIVREWLTVSDHFLELLKLLGTTPFIAKLVMAHHEAFRAIEGEEYPDRAALVASVRSQVSGLDSEKSVAQTLHRIRGLWTLRIAADDLLRALPVQTTTSRISDLADACLEGALQWCLQKRAAISGAPVKPDGEGCRVVALALGKLGGSEINYSSDVDLIFVYDDEGHTNRSPSCTAAQHFDRVISDFLKIMSGAGSSPAILRVDLRLRPEGSQGPILMSLDQTLNYYDSAGRTWERQALIKMRPCAGDLELGRTFLRSIEPFVYRRYLSAVEIAEIQAMKRRIENRARSEGVSRWDVKTGFGGIRDIEFVVQFLQLLNGCTLPSLREPNTIRSLGLLKSAGCLTPIEHDALLRNYVFLRNTEHRLQLEEDRQTHRIPQKIESRRTLALLMGFNPLNAWESAEGPFERFLHQYVKLTEENNAILNRLLHDAFRTEDSTCADPASDLILDPEMPSDVQNRILDSFGLIDKPRVIRHLECMAREEKPYFSTPRCRHFFAAIAPKLLQRIAQTPNPDATLAQVDTITQVLPVKGLLWESLSSSTAALDGFVSMASENRFVADLIQARPRVWENWYRVIVREYPESHATFEPPRLSANANPLERLAALREARDQRWLEIAAGHARPLTVDSVRSMGKMASAVADMTIRAIAETLWNDQAARTSAGFAKPPGSWAILALGKLGSESLSFHSDLDLVFMHEADPALTSAKDKNAAERYFGDLASRFLKSASERGPGFLYRVDTRLRPFGGSGSLSVPLCQMRAYYRSGDARVWERLALLRARPLFVAGFDAEKLLAETVSLAFIGCTESETVRGELAAVRERIRRSIEANPDDLKRSEGGSQAIELLVQALQLIGYDKSSAHVERDEFAAIGHLTETGRISIQQAKSLIEAYGLYRQVDWALRLYRNRVPDPFRIDPKEWLYLERMIDSPVDPKIPLNDRIERARASVREIVRQFLEGNL